MRANKKGCTSPLITMPISIVQQSFMYQIMLKLTCQLKAIFTKMELQMFHLTNTF